MLNTSWLFLLVPTKFIDPEPMGLPWAWWSVFRIFGLVLGTMGLVWSAGQILMLIMRRPDDEL